MNPHVRTILLYGVIFAGAWLGWTRFSALLEAGRKARENLPVLAETLRAARASIALHETARNELIRLKEQFRGVDMSAIAPPDDPFSWAHTDVTMQSRAAGLETISIAASTDRPPPHRQGADGPWLVPYRLSMEFSGTEIAALRFVCLVEETNPYAQFHHLSILAPHEGDKFTVFATIEWPMWASAEKAAQIRMWRDQAAR